MEHEHSQHIHPTHEHHDMQHPSPKMNEDGKGMYDEHAGHHIEDFKKRFWICLIITIQKSK